MGAAVSTLFPLPPVIADAPLTAEQMLERKRAKRRAAETPRGYAFTPGTGPEGETCKTCAHCKRFEFAKAFHKCAKASTAWTHSRRTDIRVASPACKFWEAA